MGKTIKFAARHDSETDTCTLTIPRTVAKDVSMEFVGYGVNGVDASQCRRIDKHTLQFVLRKTHDPLKVLAEVLDDEITSGGYRIGRLRIETDDPEFWYHVVALVAHESYEWRLRLLTVERDESVATLNRTIDSAHTDIDGCRERIQAIDAEVAHATRAIRSSKLAQRNRCRAKEPNVNKIAQEERILAIMRETQDWLADLRVTEQYKIIDLKQRIRAWTKERDELIASVERKLAKVAEVPDEMLRRIVGLE